MPRLITNLLTAALVGLFMSEPRIDTDFLNTASRSNLAGIAAGKIAAEKASREDIRNFADSIVADQERAERELRQIAVIQGTVVAGKPDTEHQRETARLKTLSGAKFDSTYLNMQVLDHQVAIQLFQQESGLGRDSLCRTYAAKYLPTLRRQLKMAKDLSARGQDL